MTLTVTISGTYMDPEGNPLPGKTITFESLYNSSQTQLKTTVQLTTDEAANYTVSLVPNFYNVCELDNKGRSKWLGNIQIFADSPPGTLNEYLTAFKVDQAQPGILAEMEEILEETKDVAEQLENYIDAENIAYIDKENKFTKITYFEGYSIFDYTVDFNKRVNIKSDVYFTGSITQFNTPLSNPPDFLTGVNIWGSAKYYLDYKGRGHGGIYFSTAADKIKDVGGIFPTYDDQKTHLIQNKLAEKLLIEFNNAGSEGIKFKASDGVERSVYNEGFPPPAAALTDTLPETSTIPTMYYIASEGALYFVVGDKKYRITLTAV
ncbi:prophage tail fiber N-terminal domain-containing protein [Enterobacter sp. LU1]|uniref:prophage tail fiber N-terminal domain-containing protein n=1 Tax=Enterobacter sp. LU1 TaxID=1848517 RepID=UPI0011EADFA5|nr:prophage tail fiber N-terminal domain-containing protein [Enterobacter sp. LU1]QEL49858.1 hypothetical protein FZF21_21625 [Enterobacter sp. LU1]